LSDTAKRKVCVVLVDRANYGRLKPVMRAIADNPALQLQVLAAGTMVLERFDLPVRVVRRTTSQWTARCILSLKDPPRPRWRNPSVFAMVEFASEFQRLKPDVILLIGDRYEALAAAIAAAYMNICIVHVQGGEVSGSIDEKRTARDHEVLALSFPEHETLGAVSDTDGRTPRDDPGHRLPGE